MSKIEVNEIDKQSGSTLTLGGSGTAVTLACGATQSGFGRTGTVDWQTSIKTAATFSASNGEGYFVDTSSNAVTANLPAGSVGAIVAFKDYAQNFDTNSLTISANGSDKIEGQTFDLELSTEGQAVTLVYGDATKGWQAVNSNEIVNALTHVAATGGSVSTVCTNFKVHTFTSPGTFCVSAAAGPVAVVDYLVIAGGGGGGTSANPTSGHGGAGGGAGGYRFSNGTSTGCYSTGAPSPLVPLGATALPVSVQGYPIVVGGGGAGTPNNTNSSGTQGSTSSFSTISSAGGGGGATRSPSGGTNGGAGGSGGGGNTGSCVGAGNTPSVSPPQGNNGGPGGSDGQGGGGGIGAVGGAGCGPGGPGGSGFSSVITSSPVARGGGGGGGTGPSSSAGTGSSGGANGSNSGTGGSGTANTGGGGGGSAPQPTGGSGGAGGSGIVIIRYKFQ